MNDQQIVNTFQGDENTNGKALKIARQQFEVLLVTTAEAGLIEADDATQFAHAIEHSYVLVTVNIKDFRPLVEQWLNTGHDFPGIVYIVSDHQKMQLISPRSWLSL